MLTIRVVDPCMTERMIEAHGIALCTESFGDPAEAPILLVAGSGSSMLWWPDELCRTLADNGRFVIRYDHRDTGRSASSPPGHPDYTGDDLVSDAIGVLDAYGCHAAHIVGVSAGGAMAQMLALDYSDRVLSLVLISTSPATPGDRGLPTPTEDFHRFVATADVDWSDTASVIDHLVDFCRVLNGRARAFDEAGTRAFIRRDLERTREVAALQNHDLLVGDDRARPPLSSIAVPTLVIHGTADPLFPFRHGEVLAEEVPNAVLLPLEGAGHGVDEIDRTTIADAILEHTGTGRWGQSDPAEEAESSRAIQRRAP